MSKHEFYKIKVGSKIKYIGSDFSWLQKNKIYILNYKLLGGKLSVKDCSSRFFCEDFEIIKKKKNVG